MGKITDALEKSGAGRDGNGNISENNTNNVSENIRDRDDGHPDSSARKKAKGDGLHAGRWDERLSLANGSSPEAAESFRVLRSRILYPDDEAKVCRTILIASTAPKEGKSFVAANLGIAMAQGVDQYSMLVDCDLRRPSLAGLFGMPGDRGLVDYLQKGTALSPLCAI